MDFAAARYNLNGALGSMGYYRVPTERISDAGAIDLNNVPAAVEDILNGIRTTTHWAEIGQQLSYLRRLDPYFGDAYLKPARHVLGVCVSLGFGHIPLPPATWQDLLDRIWIIFQSLQPLIKAFELPEVVKTAAVKLIDLGATAYGMTGSVSQAVLPIVRAAVDIHVSSGPMGHVVGLALAGISSELANSSSAHNWYRRDNWSFSGPSLDGIVWDALTNSCHAYSASLLLNSKDLQTLMKPLPR